MSEPWYGTENEEIMQEWRIKYALDTCRSQYENLAQKLIRDNCTGTNLEQEYRQAPKPSIELIFQLGLNRAGKDVNTGAGLLQSIIDKLSSYRKRTC